MDLNVCNTFIDRVRMTLLSKRFANLQVLACGGAGGGGEFCAHVQEWGGQIHTR